MAAASHRQGVGDRLSALPDNVLEHVLSHLTSVEAVRTSALSRRWRDVYEAVPVVDLVDTKTGDRCDRFDDLKICFDHQVASAILCKGARTPIRAFRLTTFYCHMVDQWIATAANAGLLDLDLTRRHNQPSTRHRHYPIFRCRALRRLRLANWTLDLPPAGSVDMASLETLCLTRITDQAGMLQQLLSSCPRLAHLTLEECTGINEEIVVVTSQCLRSFTMIGCHDAAGIKLQTTCLRSLHYNGPLPPSGPFFIVVSDYLTVEAARIDICEDLSTIGPREVAPVMTLISRCKRLRYLDLSLSLSMAYYSSLFAPVLRDLPCLKQLGFHGCLLADHTVRSIVALLLNAKDLEVLSLLPLAPEPPKTPKKNTTMYYTDSDDSDTEPEDNPAIKCTLNDGVECSGQVPESLWRTHVRCLDQKVTRISIGNYQGLPVEKMLARFLLSRAAKLEEFSVQLAAGLRPPQKDAIARELTSWRWNRHTRIICN